MNVLIAEDDVVTRHLLETLLSRWGYKIVSAEDGSRALELLPSLPIPTLVLLDWMMPGVTGTDVCRSIRKRYSPQDAYVIMLTALNQAEDVIEGLEAGVDDYLCKPMTPFELRARLQIGARILSIEGELIGTRKKLAYEIDHDEATGVLNRNSILNVLARNIEQSFQQNFPLAIALVRIDSRYARSLSLEIESAVMGGAADSMIGAAQSAIRCVRAYDAFGRFGDDSFLAIFPGVGEEAAINLAMRLLAGLNQQTSLVPVAANIGIAAVNGASGANVDSLIHAAERALRTAVQRGPNRIEVAAIAEELILPSYQEETATQN